MEQCNNNLFVFSAGIGAGLLAAWAIVEFFPLIVLGGAGYIVMRNLKHTVKENPICQEVGQDQK